MFSGRKTAGILLLMNSSGSVSGKVISRVDEITLKIVLQEENRKKASQPASGFLIVAFLA